MHHFGLYVCDENLHPMSREKLELMAPAYVRNLQDCSVYLLGNSELSLADAALNFGAPVHIVVETPRHPGVDYLLDHATLCFDATFVFVVTYPDPTDKPGTFHRCEIIGTCVSDDWKQYATKVQPEPRTAVTA